MKTLPIFLHFAGGTVMSADIRDRIARILRPTVRTLIARRIALWSRRRQPRLCLRKRQRAKADPAMGPFMGACVG